MDTPTSSRALASMVIRHETDGINTWVAYRLTFDDGTQLDIAGHSAVLDALHERLMLGDVGPVTVTFPLTMRKNPAGGRDGL